MGQGLMASVFYGLDLGGAPHCRTEEQHNALPDWLRDDTEEWDDVLAAQLGWRDMPYPPITTPQDDPMWETWIANRKQRATAITNFGVGLRYYGRWTAPGIAIAVSASIETSYPGPVVLSTILSTPEDVLAEWRARIEEFCSLLGIFCHSENIAWQLAASLR